ncbi:T7SS effector LXG polymorphic toxin, partial [Halalkalibacter sp. APA_J-10(15)]|uniref:T7SS effector LXG polymorphic toxin n=1 Tax=Halalkalibacter sp. APA_J-10(15) TaxID=2933805 RepID=UPI001FF64F27
MEEQKKEMNALRLGLSEVESNINQIIEMETFKGETANAAKTYFRDYHGTLLQAFIGLSHQLERNLMKHLNDFKTNVDSNDLTVLDQSYIEDQEEDIHRMYKQLEGISKEIDAIIKSVSDITSAQSPSFSNVMNR